MTENILLDINSSQDLLPKFESININDIESALDYILKENRELIEGIAHLKEPTWENFVKPLEDIGDRLDKFWSPISHIDAVKDSEELREIIQACLPKLSNYGTEISQDLRLYKKFDEIKNSEEFASLNEAQQKIIDNALRDFRLSGINLSQEKKQRLKEIQEKLSSLTNQYSNNVLDSTQAWTLDITDEADLAGLPESARSMAKQYAEAADIEGWRITLDAPSFIPFMTYADSSELREKLYRKYVTRASDMFYDEDGDFDGRKWDNGENMVSILSLRQEKAKLLGFYNYAEVSIEPKMAESPEQVIEFLEDLANKAKPSAEKEVKDLHRFVEAEFSIEELNPWDIGYYSEKLRQKLYDFTQEDVRPYFPVDKAIDGLFKITGQLFNLSFERTETEHLWHKDAQYYRIFDKDSGDQIGGFYFDLYARAHKRGGAWMADCVSRRKLDGKTQLPIAFLTCNFTPPVGDNTALLTHDEVTTLFHEFGHGLHHMLTEVDEISVSGIAGVAWDAVELPSQFLENWCWEREGLDVIAAHHKTNKPLPDELLEKMKRAKNFQSAMGMVRQLEFSLFDIKLHQATDIGHPNDIQEVLDNVRRSVAVIQAPKFNRFQNGFSHIFAGGYAAGYYSYKWAEVLSADAFSKFEEEGIMNTETGMLFRKTVLANGGVKPAMELFKAFRGREPNVDALLRHSGLATA